MNQDMPPPVEAIVMSRFEVPYIAAMQIVNKARESLGMRVGQRSNPDLLEASEFAMVEQDDPNPRKPSSATATAVVTPPGTPTQPRSLRRVNLRGENLDDEDTTESTSESDHWTVECFPLLDAFDATVSPKKTKKKVD